MDIINLQQTFTNAEKNIVASVFETWCNQCIDKGNIPLIGIAAQKGGDGKDITILKASEYTNSQIKDMLIKLSNAL